MTPVFVVKSLVLPSPHKSQCPPLPSWDPDTKHSPTSGTEDNTAVEFTLHHHHTTNVCLHCVYHHTVYHHMQHHQTVAVRGDQEAVGGGGRKGGMVQIETELAGALQKGPLVTP